MKTDELIVALSENLPPARPARPWRNCALAAAAGAAVAVVILVLWLGLRPLHEAMRMPSFWMKAAYTAGLALAALPLAAQLSRPGADAGRRWALLALPLAVLAALAALQLSHTPAEAHPALWMGHSWRRCPWRILALSLPVYAALIWAMRRLAPTEPVRAGAAAGLLAGAVGATVYGFYCQETAAPFVVLWYTLGVAASAILGALAGSRLLRW